VTLKRDFFPEHKLRRSLLGPLAVGVALLWTVNAAEPDMCSAGVVQDFYRVAVEEGNDRGGKVQREYG
jgi:hypothetical protein